MSEWPAAVLWDLDGTLIDTEPYWQQAEQRLAEIYGGEWRPEHSAHIVGMALLDAADYLRTALGLAAGREELCDHLVADVVECLRRHVPWRPGARELLAQLTDFGLPCGLVTMSYQRIVDPVVETLPDDTFAVVVTGDDVQRGKPDPEPYRTAAARLGLPAFRCLAIEDSINGARSAMAAGCPTVVVPDRVVMTPGEGRVIRDTLVGMDLPALRALQGCFG